MVVVVLASFQYFLAFGFGNAFGKDIPGAIGTGPVEPRRRPPEIAGEVGSIRFVAVDVVDLAEVLRIRFVVFPAVDLFREGVGEDAPDAYIKRLVVHADFSRNVSVIPHRKLDGY